MRFRYPLLGAALVCVLLCGAWRNQAQAPMTEHPGQVEAVLTPLPEDLSDAALLAKTGNLVVADSGTLYEVKTATSACRRMVPPEDGTLVAITAGPDGGLWAVLRRDADQRLVLLKSLGGSVLIRQELEISNVDAMLCDAVGHVFLTGDGQLLRLSPEGQPEASLMLPVEGETALAAGNDRVFLACRTDGTGAYWEIQEDMTLGQPISGCVDQETLCPVGSFLPDYILMEHDQVGLYGCTESGQWELLCRWSDLHLDGNISQNFITDSQGRPATLYTKDGSRYCLTLQPSGG
jgi:hypothetical protein